jgi:type I restriction enzyme M protein
MLANPPFGVDWKAEKKVRSTAGPASGRFGGRLPRINDGACSSCCT